MPAAKNKKVVAKSRVKTKPKSANRSRVQKKGPLARAPKLSKPVMALVAGLVVLVGAFVIWMAVAATPADYTPAGIATKGLDPTGKTLPSFDYQVPTTGRVVYMAPADRGGNDTNDGLALERPVATITRAYNQLKSGGNASGTIVLRGGEYRSWFSGDVNIAGSTTKGKIAGTMTGGNITFQAYRSEKPWFVGTDPVKDGWASASTGVWMRVWSTPDFCSSHLGIDRNTGSLIGNYRTKVPRLDGALVSPVTAGLWEKATPFSDKSGISMNAPRICAHPDTYWLTADTNRTPADVDTDPQMVVSGGVQLTQKKTLAELSTSPNSFFYDWANEQMYVNKDPNANTLELTKRHALLLFGGAYRFEWKGIGVKHFASSPLHAVIYAGLGGAGSPNAGELIVENSVFLENSGNTIDLSGPKLGSTVRRSIFASNGYTGFGSNGFASSSGKTLNKNSLLIDSSIFNDNNKSKLDTACGASCGAAAVKLNNMSGYTVKNSIFENTNARSGGLWCDIDCSNAVMVNNISRNNGGFGIFYEISSKGIIANNLLYNNGTQGISVYSSEVKVYNNTIINRDGGSVEGVKVADDDRPAPDKGETWPYSNAEEAAAVVTLCTNAKLPPNCRVGSSGPNTNRVEYVNNLVVGQSGLTSAGAARLNSFGNNGYQFPPNTLSSDYFSAFDYNAYYHKTTQSLYRFGNTDNIKTPASLRTVSGQPWDLNAIQVTAEAVPDPFIDRAGQDFRLKADSLAATNKGKALPADVAAAIGVPAGTVPVRGVIFPATSLPTTTTTVTPTTTTTVTPAPVNQPPVGPTTLTGFGSSTTQINLTWPAATDDSAVKNYILTRNGTQVYSGTALSFNDTGLAAGTTYQYKIVAVDAAGLSSTGATAAVKTMETPLPPADSLPPTAPTNVKAGLSFNATRFSYDNILKWTASTDTGGSGMQDYLVRRNGADLGTAVSPTFTDSSIVANTLYSYEILARDRAGNVSAPGTARLVGRCFLIWCWAE
ncbi:MAG: hypothetical protein QG658_500 [Patescibacteria group bacterium]|nr:hypothetical protein [Patescibacteria group bacterium]